MEKEAGIGGQEMRDREKQKEFRKTPEGKAARKEESRKYYEAHKEEIIRKSKEYADKNADKIREYRKEYRKKNREKLKQKNKEYYDSLSPERRAKFFKECQVRHSIRRAEIESGVGRYGDRLSEVPRGVNANR